MRQLDQYPPGAWCSISVPMALALLLPLMRFSSAQETGGIPSISWRAHMDAQEIGDLSTPILALWSEAACWRGHTQNRRPTLFLSSPRGYIDAGGRCSRVHLFALVVRVQFLQPSSDLLGRPALAQGSRGNDFLTSVHHQVGLGFGESTCACHCVAGRT